MAGVRKTDKARAMLLEFAAHNGIGERAAQKHRKRNSPQWIQWVDEHGRSEFALEAGITCTTEFTPGEALKRARMVHEKMWAEYEAAARNLEEKRAGGPRYGAKSLTEAQKGLKEALGLWESAKRVLEGAEQAADRLVHVSHVEGLMRDFGEVTSVLKNVPSEVAAACGDLFAEQAERAVRAVLMARVNPLIERMRENFRIGLGGE